MLGWVSNQSRACARICIRNGGALFELSLKYGSIRPFSTTYTSYRNPRLRNRRFEKTVNKMKKRIMTPEDLFAQAANVDVKNIKKQYDQRTNARYIQPNKQWLSKICGKSELTPDFNYMDTKENRKVVEEILVKKLGSMRKSTDLNQMYFTELNIGDVVDLSGSLDNSDLAVVVELPNSPEDTRYTLVNRYGGLEFVSRFRMGFRIPAVFPQAWLQNCVMDETPFLTEFSDRYNESLAPIGQPKYQIENCVDSRSRMFDSVIARATAATEDGEVISKDDRAHSYILPSILAGILSSNLTGIVNSAWEKLPEINLKMEVLHNVLQCNESPVQLAFYQLYKSVMLTDLNSLVKGLTSGKAEEISKTYKLLLNKMSEEIAVDNQFDSTAVGRNMLGNVDIHERMNINSLYGFILGLRKNSQIYQFNSGDMIPSFVTLIPLSNTVKFNRMVQAFKSNDGYYDELCQYLVKKTGDNNNKKNAATVKPRYYDCFIELLKLYVAVSFDDNILESFVIKIVRGLPDYKDIDITRTIIYELLLKLGEISANEDPLKWWYNAMIPNSGVSAKSDLEDQYYHALNTDNISKYLDMNYDTQKSREKYEDVIYCIDSKDPLEIDDGISVRKVSKDEYVVSSFIANPSSFMEPNLQMSRIAFERGQTLYLPKLNGTDSLSMLPFAFGQEIQLGYPEKPTRVVRISFKINMNTGKVEYLDSKHAIGFGTATKFVKVDYDSVNEILKDSLDANKILFGLSERTGVDQKVLASDLKQLYAISSQLANNAKKNGRTNVFDFFHLKKEVEEISSDANDQIHLKFKEKREGQGQGSGKSETLVSEIMVMSNHVAGKFFVDNKIPAVFRIQGKLPMSKKVEKTLGSLLQKGNQITFRDMMLIQDYMTKSSISPVSSKHESLNLDAYATVTSPLRRFWDLINHWQLQAFVETGKPKFDVGEINYMTMILKFKDELNRKISRRIISFYMFKVLKQMEGNEKQKFRCIVTKKPSDDGLINVMLLDYGVRSVLQTSWYAADEKSKNIDTRNKLLKDIEIGDIIDDAEISDIDLLSGWIVLKSGSY